MSFLTQTDIGNRALQHCGARRMDPTQGFSESSGNAAAVSFCYDKLRQAELRRNVWRFAIKRAILRAIDTTTMLLAPALWVSTTTYFVGSLVADEDGTLWQSVIPNNLGNQPQNSLTWQQYFGPLTVSLYASTAAYSAGELVYTAAGDGTNRVYLSRQSDNSDVPATATAWAATAPYNKNQVVTYLSVAYMSLLDLNIAQTPTASAANWAIGTTYALNALVNGSDGVTYRSLVNGNVGHDPISDGGLNWLDTGVLTAWTPVFTAGAGSIKWLQLGGAEFPMGVGLAELNIIYPLTSGPSSESASRNAFRLPSGYLRKAPADPKAGSSSSLGAPSNLAYDDWNFEDSYIVSAETGPIVLRFVADMVDVTRMDPMFCEGLAARIGWSICEEVTQSTAKLETIKDAYNKTMTEARIVNGIETGAEEPPLDDYISCRA